MVFLSDRRRVRVRRTLLCLSTILAGGGGVPAFAQITPQSAFNVHSTVDSNGVDLSTGAIILPLASVAIGDPSSTGMRFVRRSLAGGWRDGFTGDIQVSGAIYTVTTGERTEQFRVAGTTYTNLEHTGTTLTHSGSLYTYTLTDGTKLTYSFAGVSSLLSPSNYGQVSAVLSDVTMPDGMTLDYDYRVQTVRWGDTTTGKPSFKHIRRLQSVTSNTGYQAQFTYFADTISTSDDLLPDPSPLLDWTWLTTVTLFNKNTDSCDVDANACSFTRNWPSVTLGGPGPVGYTSFTDNAGRTTAYAFVNGNVTAMRRPGSAADDLVASYSGGRVSQVVLDGVTTSYGYVASGSALTTTRTAGGNSESYAFDSNSQLTSYTNQLGKTTAYQYGSGVTTQITQPENNYVVYTPDARGNITQTEFHPKPSSSDPVITTQASYDPTCSNVLKCNKPNTTTDALGNVTSYSYDPATGDLTSVEQPAAAAGGVRPETRYSYTVTGGVRQLSGISSCAVGAAPACVGTADETRTTIGHGSVAANNLLPVSVTQGSGTGSVTATTTAAYDPVGNVLAVDGPLAGAADTTTYRYDDAREPIGVISADPDGGGVLVRQAQRTSYRADGLVTKTELGTVSATDDTAWAGFVSLEQATPGYDANDRRIKQVLSAGGTTYAVSQYSYDALGRPECSTMRMNPALWGSQPVVCTPQTSASAGPDRIVETEYDAAGRVRKVTTGHNTGDAVVELATYTDNGLPATVTDGEGNKSAYSYDGFDRLSKIQYPKPEKGAQARSETDYALLEHDANGNVTERDLRGYDADATQKILYSYDDLNRITLKDLPGSEPDVTYSYDNLGRPTGASQSGNAHVFTYDALGRLLTQSGPLDTMTSSYDAGGRRTRLAWDDGFYVDYEYDVLGNMTKVRENGASSGVGVLASYAYDDLGRRTSLTRGNGAITSYAFDPVSRLSSLVHNPAGTADDLTLGFTYDAAGGIKTATRSNDTYAWDAAATATNTYTSNGLDQYTLSGGTVLRYDARGNLTTWGTDTYGYSSENLLKTGPSSTTLSYDPLLRLFQMTQGSATTKFGYDGQALTGEYDASNTLTKRYVYGPGSDEPLVQYAGTGTTARSWLIADERGSVIATADDTGAVTAKNSYDEYGVPGSANTGRFQYTGQEWVPELGLYYYKARMYAPSLGRFLQTDPIGYADGLNWYNYVGGDPVNFVDPSGTKTIIDENGCVVKDGIIVSCPDVIVNGGGGGDWVDYGHTSIVDGWVEQALHVDVGAGGYFLGGLVLLQNVETKRCDVRETYPIPKGYVEAFPGDSRQIRRAGSDLRSPPEVNPAYQNEVDNFHFNVNGIVQAFNRLGGEIVRALSFGRFEEDVGELTGASRSTNNTVGDVQGERDGLDAVRETDEAESESCH